MSTAKNAREAILSSVRAALHDVLPHEQPDDVAVARNYQQTAPTPHSELVAQFIEHTADYKAIVHHVQAAALPARIAQSCNERGIRQMVVPADVPDDWLSTESGITFVPDEDLSHSQLETSGGVLTGCALGIAQTGTIVLDGGAHQGRRVITLLPDYHLCVIYASQIVGIVPEAIARLAPAVQTEGRPITFISGPSATSDIELNRVEGVHGPRTLEILVVEQAHNT
jgi:L-lactate dehydrogenase complex protein LldG